MLPELAHYCKGEFESYDKAADDVTFNLDDTNLPCLWSAEGIARLLRGVFGMQKGIPKIKVSKGNYEILVDQSVSSVRPFIAGFIAKGKKIDGYLLKQLVQLQEKLCESYGRKRRKVSIGLYSYRRIKFPVHYKAVNPESVSFIPLGMKDNLTLSEILDEHPKGRDYSFILKNAKKYPILQDSKGEVLSFPPIINSNYLGKIEVNDSDIFFEVTGNDQEAVHLATNVFAYAMHDRGFSIYSAAIKYGNRKEETPFLKTQKIRITREQVRQLLGLDMKDSQIKSLVEKAGFSFSNYSVEIPPYRADIMHPFDVIEDIAIMFGFSNIPPLELESYTIGQKLPIIDFADKIRELVIGLGYQEVMSPILSNKAALYQKMNSPDTGTVEIESYMSELFSVVRSWLTPLCMEVLSKNKHVDYPQRIFEQGLATERRGSQIEDYEKIAIVSAHSTADFTEAKQVLEHLMRQLDIKFELKESDMPSFIPGRCASIIVKGKTMGFLGEINPAVLSSWGLEMPAVAVELNLSGLYSLSENK